MKRLRRFDVREKAGWFIVVFLTWLAGNLAVAFLLNVPRSERAASLREGFEELQKRRLEDERKVAAMREEYERVMGGRRTLETFYQEVLSTKRERMTAVQKEIREIAGRFHINPETISYARQIFDYDQVVKFTAVLPLNGSYENLRAFINAVENSDNFLTIEAVMLTDSKEGGVILSLNVSLATYFLDPDVVPKQRPRAAGRS